MKPSLAGVTALVLALWIEVCACGQRVIANSAREEPPAVQVEQLYGGNVVKVAHPELFPLATVTAHGVSAELNVTGVISADVSRNVPVVSMASGRILEVHARLGDSVKKGQLLMRVQSADLADAFSDYRQAVADERLAVAQLTRSKVLYDKGAIAKRDLEIMQEAEEKADVVVETTAERIRVHDQDEHSQPYKPRPFSICRRLDPFLRHLRVSC